MKIPITEDTVGEIVTLIYIEAQKVIKAKVAQLEDVELIAQLRAQSLDDYSRVLAYLNQTKAHRRGGDETICVASSSIAVWFGLHAPAMKRIRDKLKRENAVRVKRYDDHLHIYYHVPTAA